MNRLQKWVKYVFCKITSQNTIDDQQTGINLNNATNKFDEAMEDLDRVLDDLQKVSVINNKKKHSDKKGKKP